MKRQLERALHSRVVCIVVSVAWVLFAWSLLTGDARSASDGGGGGGDHGVTSGRTSVAAYRRDHGTASYHTVRDLILDARGPVLLVGI